MFMPELTPVDGHLPWKTQSSRPKRLDQMTTQQQRKSNHTTSSEYELPHPALNHILPLSNYTPATSNPLPYASVLKNHSPIGEILYTGNVSVPTSILDRINLKVATERQYIRSQGNLGMNYIKPIGVDKTMIQIMEEQEIGDQEELMGEDGLIADEEDNEVLDEAVDEVFEGERELLAVEDGTVSVTNGPAQTAASTTTTREQQSESEVDLDAELSDGDEFGINYESLYDDNEDDDTNEATGTSHYRGGFNGNILPTDNNDGEMDDGFMASEEYQEDHTINMTTAKRFPWPGAILDQIGEDGDDDDFNSDEEIAQQLGTAATIATGTTRSNLSSNSANYPQITADTSPNTGRLETIREVRPYRSTDDSSHHHDVSGGDYDMTI